MFQSFYSSVAQASFTLLGLWWVVLQIRYGPWMRDMRIRRAVIVAALLALGVLLGAALFVTADVADE